MNGTPRLRSAYPPSPQSSVKRPLRDGATRDRPNVGSSVENTDGASSPPIIPFDTIDAPTQRFYVFAFWIALLGWRLYDFYLLLIDESESLWLFMKWAAIDATFLYGVPALRIPWLEWSTVTVTVLFLLHAICNIFLMFRIMPPFQAPLIYFAKLLYDKELAITERRVKAADILHNSSLILGKQVIHILPEGSAMLNPQSEPFCLDSSKKEVFLPIMINQTNPVSVELRWTDLETMHNETLTISSTKLKSMRRDAEKVRKSSGGTPKDPLLLRYPVKSTGIYRLRRIIDESKLEVRGRPADVMVVTCPSARINTRSGNRCRGELSDLALEVEGTPPLKVKYRKLINEMEQKVTLQSIQPRDYIMAPVSHDSSQALVHGAGADISWARKQNVVVPLNESLTNGGRWTYSVAEVEDRLGNVVTYTADSEGSKYRSKGAGLRQDLTVHERPKIQFRSCNSRNPLRVAVGQSAILALNYSSTAAGPIVDTSYEVAYLFTPADGSADTGPEMKRVSLKPSQRGIASAQAGLYTLGSVSTEFCKGEILEPAACLLHNPPEPKFFLKATEEFDKCAGRPIGLRVQLDFVGTPPFDVQYRTERTNGHPVVLHRTFDSMSGELELGTPYAGWHKYTFTEISDAVYKGHVIKNQVLEQEIKSVAQAGIVNKGRRKVCIGQPVPFDIMFRGEAPWTLEYQLVHGGKRIKHGTTSTDSESYTLLTDPLTAGGNYTLSLLSVSDGLGCKEVLSEESKVHVQMSKPRAGFASVDGRHSSQVLEGASQELPIRLSGEGPWTLAYRNTRDESAPVLKKTLKHENDRLVVHDPGVYELVSVSDALCPGDIESTASEFEAGWIPRPQISISESSVVTQAGAKYVKHEVCEGDEDNVELTLNGAPPFDINYSVEPPGGKRYLKQIVVPQKTASLRMDTEKAGLVQYSFTQPGDGHYKSPRSKTPVLHLEQRVHARPDAKFVEQGKTYSYCSADGDDEQVIPITLTGQPPFYVEVELKHQSTSRPQTASFPNIPASPYDLRIPHRMLAYGSSTVRIRKVRDARGCQRRLLDASAAGATLAAPRVLVSVHTAPTITPLEPQTHFCVGDRLSFALAGAAPFDVFYTFNDVAQKARVHGTTFRRLAERAGTFAVTAVTDRASGGACRAPAAGVAPKVIHAMPSVRVSRGHDAVVDIHEGGSAEILFEFGGTPPFEFAYTRSANEGAGRGKRGQVLETRKEVSYEYSMRVRASEEGTYEVVSIRDAHCAFSKHGSEEAGTRQKLLQY